MMRFATAGRGIAFGSFLLSACSSFNMSPDCRETGPGLMRHLAVSDSSTAPDPMRLSSLMTVSRFREIGADYNARTCGADVAAFGRSIDVQYRIQQSEGVKDWYEIEILNANDPALTLLTQELRSAYAR